jgi:hypothetical protein
MPIRLQRRPGCRIDQIVDRLGIVLKAINLDWGGDLAELKMCASSEIIDRLLATTQASRAPSLPLPRSQWVGGLTAGRGTERAN